MTAEPDVRAPAGRRLLLWAPVLAMLVIQVVLSSRSQLPPLPLLRSLPASDKIAHAGWFFLLGLLAYTRFVRRDPLAAPLGLWAMLGGALGFPLGQCPQAWHAWNRADFQTGFWARLDPHLHLPLIPICRCRRAT